MVCGCRSRWSLRSLRAGSGFRSQRCVCTYSEECICHPILRFAPVEGSIYDICIPRSRYRSTCRSSYLYMAEMRGWLTAIELDLYRLEQSCEAQIQLLCTFIMPSHSFLTPTPCSRHIPGAACKREGGRVCRWAARHGFPSPILAVVRSRIESARAGVSLQGTDHANLENGHFHDHSSLTTA